MNINPVLLCFIWHMGTTASCPFGHQSIPVTALDLHVSSTIQDPEEDLDMLFAY